MIVRCSCGFTGNVPDSHAGMKIVCRQCGVPLIATPAAGLSPQQMQQAHNHQFAFDQQESWEPIGSQPNPAREPWYYRYCYSVTVFLLVIDLVLVALGLFLWLGFGAYVASQARDFGEAFMAYILASYVMVLWTALVVIFTLYWFSFVLVFIDAARHVRRIFAAVRTRPPN